MNAPAKSLLIIFYRNPGLGKVKTRLAAAVGEEKALAVYTLLTNHTIGIAQPVEVNKVVYYSEYVDREDNWPNISFEKQLQKGNDLGERMLNAFADGFSNGYESICIIGTDCFELTSEIIAKAFKKLETKDAVIGPAHDGGYYLLGMTNLLPALFKDKEWGTGSVCADTIVDLRSLGQNFFQLELLRDVDREQDLPAAIRLVIGGQR
jgi:rSAM/selenodomain-associated transferase 1